MRLLDASKNETIAVTCTFTRSFLWLIAVAISPIASAILEFAGDIFLKNKIKQKF